MAGLRGTFGKPFGGLWEAFGGPLEGPWEAFGRPLGRLLMTLGLPEALRGAQEAPRGPQEVPKRRPRGTQRRPRAFQGHSKGPFGVAFSREKPIKNRIRFQTAFYVHFRKEIFRFRLIFLLIFRDSCRLIFDAKFGGFLTGFR